MKKFSLVLVLVVALALLLTSCGEKKLTAYEWQATMAAMPTATLAPTVTLEPTATATATLAPTATTEPTLEQQPPTSANCGNSKLQILYLTVVNPESASQPQIGHPTSYEETHVSGVAVCVILDVPENYVGIVGGTNVDDKSGGYYTAFGPGHYEKIVINGFGLITTQTWAKAEWQFRLDQVKQYGWALAASDPGPLK